MGWFYKGHKIRKFHKNIFTFAMICIVFLLTITIGIPIFLNVGIQKYELRFLTENIKVIILVNVILLAMLILPIRQLYNMQKLCRMIFSAGYYNNVGNNLAYFPSIYYRKLKNCCIQITFKLDGNKNHEKFLSMGDILGHMFNMETVEQERKSWYLTYTLEHINPNRIYLGKTKIDYEGSKIPLMKGLVWDFDKSPHALVTGSTGGGKTFFLIYLIRSLLILKADVRIIDPKRSDLSTLDAVLGEDKVRYATGGVIKMLRDAVTEMDERYKVMSASEKFGVTYRDYDMQPHFIVFDEFVAFIESLQEKSDKRNVDNYLAQIVLKGRQAGFFLIFATQRADAKYLKGSIRDNLGLRVSLGSLEKAGYKMTFGDADNIFEKFKSGHGYTYISGTTTSVRQLYSPHLGLNYDVYADLRAILQQETEGETRSGSSDSAQPLPAGSPQGLHKEENHGQ